MIGEFNSSLGVEESAVSSSSTLSGAAGVVDGEMNWEAIMKKHHQQTYGLSEDSVDQGVQSGSTVQEDPMPRPQPSPPAFTSTAAKPSRSPGLKSPVTKSRRLVDKIVDRYDGAPLSASLISQRNESGRKANKVLCRSAQDGSPGAGSEPEPLRPPSQLEHRLPNSQERDSLSYDWAHSPLVPIALNGEDDALASDLDSLLKQLERRHHGMGWDEGMSSGGHGERDSVLRGLYPQALRMLVQLHRDLRCPAKVHKAFYAGHCHPSAFNFAVILSRLFTLHDSRIILLELIRAAAGNPSPRLVSRMLKTQKEDRGAMSISGNKKAESAELLLRLNYSGQSPKQIRERARATTIANSIAEIDRVPGSSGISGATSEGSRRQSNFSQLNSNPDSQRRSSLMMSVADIKKDLLKPALLPAHHHAALHEEESANLESFDTLKNEQHQSSILKIIVESEDEEDDDSFHSNVLKHSEPHAESSMKTLLEERCPGVEGGILSYMNCTDASKRVSAIGFHPALLQRLCGEWFDSLPWKEKVTLWPLHCRIT